MVNAWPFLDGCFVSVSNVYFIVTICCCNCSFVFNLLTTRQQQQTVISVYSTVFCYYVFILNFRFRYDRIAIQSHLRTITTTNTRIHSTAKSYVYWRMGLKQQKYNESTIEIKMFLLMFQYSNYLLIYIKKNLKNRFKEKKNSFMSFFVCFSSSLSFAILFQPVEHFCNSIHNQL